MVSLYPVGIPGLTLRLSLCRLLQVRAHPIATRRRFTVVLQWKRMSPFLLLPPTWQQCLQQPDSVWAGSASVFAA